jgi:hypothetical protein
MVLGWAGFATVKGQGCTSACCGVALPKSDFRNFSSGDFSLRTLISPRQPIFHLSSFTVRHTGRIFSSCFNRGAPYAPSRLTRVNLRPEIERRLTSPPDTLNEPPSLPNRIPCRTAEATVALVATVIQTATLMGQYYRLWSRHSRR